MRSRRAEPRIIDLATYPRQDVSPTVAGEFLGLDDRGMKAFLDKGVLQWFWRGRRRRIRLSDLVEFHRLRNAGSAVSVVSRETSDVERSERETSRVDLS